MHCFYFISRWNAEELNLKSWTYSIICMKIESNFKIDNSSYYIYNFKILDWDWESRFKIQVRDSNLIDTEKKRISKNLKFWDM